MVGSCEPPPLSPQTLGSSALPSSQGLTYPPSSSVRAPPFSVASAQVSPPPAMHKGSGDTWGGAGFGAGPACLGIPRTMSWDPLHPWNPILGLALSLSGHFSALFLQDKPTPVTHQHSCPSLEFQMGLTQFLSSGPSLLLWLICSRTQLCFSYSVFLKKELKHGSCFSCHG